MIPSKTNQTEKQLSSLDPFKLQSIKSSGQVLPLNSPIYNSNFSSTSVLNNNSLKKIQLKNVQSLKQINHQNFVKKLKAMQNPALEVSPEKSESPLKRLPPIIDAKQWASTIKTPLKMTKTQSKKAITIDASKFQSVAQVRGTPLTKDASTPSLQKAGSNQIEPIIRPLKSS